MKNNIVKIKIKSNNGFQTKLSKHILTKHQQKAIKGGKTNADAIPLFIVEEEGEL